MGPSSGPAMPKEPTLESFVQIGTAYKKNRITFDHFAQSVLSLSTQVPSLEFDNDQRDSDEIRFSFLGQRQCLRHSFGEWTKGYASKITRLYKADKDDATWTEGSSIAVDSLGNVFISSDAARWTLPMDGERIFFYLIAGH